MTCFTFNILNYVNIILRGWLHSLIAAHVEGSFSSSSISLAELCSLRWAAGGAACTKGLRAAPSCHDFPTKSTLKTQNHFYSLVWGGVWLPNAEQRLCRVKLHLDKAVLENQVGFCPIQWGFAEGEGITPFPGRAGHTLLFQPWVSEVSAEIVQFCWWCCIFSFSSFLLWPLVVSGWMQRGQEWEWEPGPADS